MNDLHSVVIDLEGIEAELELLNDLLQLYDEHREEELSGVKMDEPYTVACLLNRQNLGLALLRSIEDKARSIQISVGAARSRLWREIKEEGSK